jgi:hypothetical protein
MCRPWISHLPQEPSVGYIPECLRQVKYKQQLTNYYLDVLSLYTRVGRITSPVEHGGDWIERSDIKTKHNISGQSIDGSVDGQTVTYSYPFREAKGLETLRSKERGLLSSAKCVVRQIRDGKIYEHGQGLVQELVPTDGKTQSYVLIGPTATNMVNVETNGTTVGGRPDYFYILRGAIPFEPDFNKTGPWALWVATTLQDQFVANSSNCGTIREYLAAS